MSAQDVQLEGNRMAIERMPEELVDQAEEIFSIPSTSYNEASMVLYLTRCMNHIPGVIYEIDDYSNILVTKGTGTYPCFVAHLDTVHIYSQGFEVRMEKIGARNFMYAVDRLGTRVGVGGDDKCGIFVCLQLLYALDNVKIVFFSQEESGGTGSENIALSFFSDCNFIGGIDRWNGKDFINRYSSSHTISKAFNKTIKGTLRRFGYSYNSGLFTDAFNVMEREVGLSCFNVSCGYYQHHTSKEYVDLNELYNSLLLCIELSKIQGQFKFEIPKTPYKSFRAGYEAYPVLDPMTNRWRYRVWDALSKGYVWSDTLPTKTVYDRYDWFQDNPSINLTPKETVSSVQKCLCCDLELLEWEKKVYYGYCNTCWPYYKDFVKQDLTDSEDDDDDVIAEAH